MILPKRHQRASQIIAFGLVLLLSVTPVMAGITITASNGIVMTGADGVTFDHTNGIVMTGADGVLDELEGVVTKLDEEHLVLRHPSLGELSFDRSRLYRVRRP